MKILVKFTLTDGRGEAYQEFDIRVGKNKLGIKPVITKRDKFKNKSSLEDKLKKIYNHEIVHWISVGICYVALSHMFIQLAMNHFKIAAVIANIVFVGTFVVGGRAFKKD